MRRIKLLAALAGSAATIAAGALAVASPANAASASPGHPAVITPQLASTSIVLNKTESDQGDNVVTFGDEGHMSVVAHLTANGHSLLGTAEIDATNPRNGNVFFVCDITSWNMTSHFGDCSPAANNTLTANTYTLTAFYLGTDILTPSVSNSITLTVNPEDSELSPFQPGSLTMTYGSETADQFNFEIIPEFAFTGTAPTGIIDVFFSSDGHELCNARLDNTGSGSCSIQAAPGVDPDIGLGVGSYVVEADYPGDVNYTGDHVSDRGAGAGTLTVSQEASNTSLAVPPDVESGESGMLTASVSPTTKGTPTGAVDFALDGQPLCSAMPIGQNGTAACPSGSLTVGTHTVTAHYEGDQNFTASDASQAFAVTLPTTVNLAVSTPSPGSMATYGQEQGVTLNVNVTSPADETPTGTVDVFAGSNRLCTITLTSAAGQCSLSPAKLRPGSYSLTASYSGDSSFSGATTPPGQAQALTITREPATTTLTPLTITTVTYGREQGVTLNANVTSPAGDTPTGTVDVFAGSNRLCTITLTSAAGQCSLSPAKLKPGSYQLTASYSGDTNYTSATTPPGQAQPLTITREPATTTLAPLTIKTVTIGHENREHLTATVKPQFTGVTPGGKVTFKAKNKAGTITSLCRNITLINGKASCTIGARKLRRGTYRLTATYAGSITYTGSTSPTSSRDTLTIR